MWSFLSWVQLQHLKDKEITCWEKCNIDPQRSQNFDEQQNEKGTGLQTQNLIVEEHPLNWVCISLKYSLNKGDLQKQFLS